MIRDTEDFYTGAKRYVQLFNAFVEKHSFVDKVRADHICYKCGSRESFEHLRTMFENESRFLFQSIIAKRRIVIIGLVKPIQTVAGEIMILELSDQKPDGSQIDKYDHIETYGTAISYEEMIRQLEQSEKVIKVERPHHSTHDIDIGESFLFRCTEGPLLNKIKTSEMV